MAFDSLIGVTIIASWLACLLFTVEIFQVRRYFKHFGHEKLLRYVVMVLALVDTIAFLAILARVYLETITHFGDTMYMLSPDPISQGIYLVGIQLSACIVQTFLIARIFKLSRSYTLAGFLELVSLTSLGGGLTLVALNCIYPRLEDRDKQTIAVDLWFISAAIVDVLITCALVYYLHMAKKRSAFQGTNSVISRLIFSAIETGSLNAILALLDVIIFATDLKTTNVPVGIVFVLGRASSFTMLYNLNSRSNLRQIAQSHPTESSGNRISLTNRRTTGLNQHEPTAQLAIGTTHYPIEIQVAKSAVTHLDGSGKLERQDSQQTFEHKADLDDTKC